MNSCDNCCWTKADTIISALKIAVAPEVFVPKEDILLSNDKTVLAGTKYFSWHVAKRLVAEDKVPQGYRLMRLSEAEYIKDHYDRSQFGVIALGLDGLINPNDMIVYDRLPTYRNCIRYEGSKGYYWLDSLEAPVYPYAISVSESRIRLGRGMYYGYGLPMLLVKDL